MKAQTLTIENNTEKIQCFRDACKTLRVKILNESDTFNSEGNKDGVRMTIDCEGWELFYLGREFQLNVSEMNHRKIYGNLS